MSTDQAEILLKEAKALRDSGDHNEAVGKLRQLVEVIPDAPPFWTLLGGTLSDLRRSEEAESAFRKALQLDPEHFMAHVGLVLCQA